MTRHLTDENIERYRRRDIDPEGRREVDMHLANCKACLELVLNSEHAVLAFNSLDEALLPSKDEAPFHFSRADLASYSAGTLDEADRIIYTSHLEDCERCQAESQTLSAVAAVESPQPTPIVAQASPDRLWASWSWLTPMRAAAAIAVVALIAFALFQWRRQSSNEPLRSDSQPNPVNSPVDSLVNSPNASGSPGSNATPASVPPGSLVVLKDNDVEIRLEQDGKTTGLEGYDDPTRQAVTAVLKGESLAKPKVLADLVSPKIQLLGTPDNDTFRLISPLGKVVIEERPTFRWRPLRGATNYVVSVFDENFNRVVQSPPVSQARWTSNVALKSGSSYTWEVRANREGQEIVSPAGPASAAKFRILEAAQQKELVALRRHRPVSQLALGLAYARAGLVSEAESEFRQLVKNNPDSEVAKKLLRTVQEWK